MKHYIVYDGNGLEVDIIKARSHNDAEKQAQAKWGENATVAYTEL